MAPKIEELGNGRYRANTDRNTVVKHAVADNSFAHVVKMSSVHCFNECAVRWELYGTRV